MLIVIGSLLPDIDSRKSYLGRFIPAWLIFKHRGFLHTLWGLLLICGAVWYFWDKEYGEALAIGYMLHLVMDSVTPNGINWLGLKKRRTY